MSNENIIKYFAVFKYSLLLKLLSNSFRHVTTNQLPGMRGTGYAWLVLATYRGQNKQQSLASFLQRYSTILNHIVLETSTNMNHFGTRNQRTRWPFFYHLWYYNGNCFYLSTFGYTPAHLSLAEPFPLTFHKLIIKEYCPELCSITII